MAERMTEERLQQIREWATTMLRCPFPTSTVEELLAEVYALRAELVEKDKRIDTLETELSWLRKENETLKKNLREAGNNW